MMVPALARPVLATPVRAFVPDAFPGLASSDRRLVLIGIDNVFIGIFHDCLDRVADLFHAYPVLAKPQYAFFPNVHLVLAKWAAPHPRRLGLHRLRHRQPQRLPRRVSITLLTHYAPAATSIPAPDHDIDHGDPSLGSPSTKVAAPSLSAPSTSAQRATTSPAPHQLPLQSQQLRRNSVHDALRLISSLTVHDVHVVHVATATTAGEC